MELSNGEVVTSVEPKLSLGDSACGLARQMDSVFSGKEMKLGFLEKDESGQNLAEEQKNRKAEELANRLNGLKEGEDPILGKELSAQDIRELPQKIQELLGPDGKFAGIYVNILGQEGQNGEASALAMVAFLDYVKAHPDQSHDQLLQGAYEQAAKVLQMFKSEVDLSVALVSKNGEVVAINTGEQEIVILDKDGKRKDDSIKEKKDADGKPTVQTAKMEDGEKIILCSTAAVEKIDGTKKVGEIVEALVKENNSAAAGEAEEAEKITTVAEKQEKLDEMAEQLRAWERVTIVDKPHGKRVSVLDYKESAEYKANQAIVNQVLKPDGKNYDPKLLELISKDEPGVESEVEYQLKIFQQLEEELRNLSEAKKNPKSLFSFFYSNDDIRSLDPIDLLTTVEASRKLLQHQLVEEIREERLRELRAQFKTVERTSEVLTKVVERGSVKKAEGDYMAIMEQGEKTPEAEADISAFELLVDHLADTSISDLLSQVRERGRGEEDKAYNNTFNSLIEELRSSKKPLSYREVAVLLKEKIHQATSPSERFNYKKAYARVRRVFYQQVNEALEQRESKDLEAVTSYVKRLISKLNHLTLTPAGMQKIIDQYQGLGLSEDGKITARDKIKEIIIERKNYPLLFDFGLKGTEYFIRMAKEPVKLPEEVDLNIVTEKQMIQGPSTLEEWAEEEIVQMPQEEDRRRIISTQTPLEPLPPSPTVTEVPKGIKEPPVAPVEVPGKKEGEPLVPAPPQGEGKGKQPEVTEVEVSQNIVFAAFAEKGKHAVQQAFDLGSTSEANFEQLFRKRGLLGGKIALTDRAADGLAQLGFKIKKGVPIPGLRTVLSLVPTIASNTLRIARHPVKYLVRGMFKPFFDNQNFRFGADVQGIVQEKAALDPHIPQDIPDDLGNLVMLKGSERRNKGFILGKKIPWVGKITNNLIDFFSDITLGHIQSSEQREGKKWLKEQLDLVDDQRDTQLKSLWQAVSERSLVEQDFEGQRFAYLGFNNLQEMEAADLTLDDVNRRVLAQAGRETRYSLAVVNENLYGEANTKLKALIEEYATAVNAGGDSEALKKKLLEDVNNYLIGENYPGGCLRSRLPDQYQKEFSGFQVANNIISLADKAADLWHEQGYLKKDEAGKTAWDKTKIDFLFGAGEWHGRRGNREYKTIEGLFGLQERINQEIVKQKLGLRESSYQEGVSIARKIGSSLGLAAKEVGIYGAAGFLGMKAAATLYAPSTALSLIGVTGLGATTGVGAIAALRERGLDIPWLTDSTGFRLRGRLELDRDRLSREMALRRSGEQRAIVRKELEGALVKAVAAAELTSEIEAVIGADRKKELTPEKAAQLLKALAEADARLGMTDRSGRKELKFRVQNFVSYTEGKQGEEGLKLHQAILDGQLKLRDYLVKNPQAVQQILPGQIVTSFSEFSQAFDKISALAKAQLCEGSKPKVAKKIEGWLRRNGEQFGVAKDEIPTLMTDLFPKVDLDIDRGESLARRERNWFHIRNTRAAETFLTVVAGGFTTGQVVKAEIGELRNLAGDIQHAGNIFRGIGEYGREWGEVFRGDVPLELNQAGQLAADVSFGQKGVLMAHSFFEKPPWSLAHQETIDNAVFTLPGGLRFREIDINGDGKIEYRAIVDVPHGRVVVDMTNNFIKGVDSDGNPLITGDVNLFNKQLADANIKIYPEPDVLGPPKLADVIKPTGVESIKNPLTGQSMNVPNGVLATNGHQWQAQWVKDGANWDLKVVDITDPKHPFVQIGKQDAILVDNARYDSVSGRLVYDHGSSLGKMNDVPSTVPGVSEIKILTPDGKIDPNGEWAKHVTEVTDRHWNEVDRLKLYDYKDQNGNLVVDFSRIARLQHRDDAGVYISLGGGSKHGIFVPDNIDGHLDKQIVFDPNSHAVIPNSGGMTLGQLSNMIVNKHGMTTFEKASELTSRQDILNLAVDGHRGYAEACTLGPGGHLEVDATITGTSSLPGSIEIPGVTETISQTVAANVIKDVVSKPIPAFSMTTPPLDFHPWFIPIPARRPLEPSLAEGKVEVPEGKQAKVTQPQDQGVSQQQKSPPLPDEERQRLEGERDQLAARVKELEDKKEASPDKKLSDEEEEELEEGKRRIDEIDATLHPPEKEEEEEPTKPSEILGQERDNLVGRLNELFEKISQQSDQKPTSDQQKEVEQITRKLAEVDAEFSIAQGLDFELKKEKYEEVKKTWSDLITTKNLLEINKQLRELGFPEISQEDSERYKEDPEERTTFIVNHYLPRIERAITTFIKRGIEAKTILNLPEKEQEALSRESQIIILRQKQQQLQTMIPTLPDENNKKQLEQELTQINEELTTSQTALQTFLQKEGLDIAQIEQKIQTKTEEIFEQQYRSQVDAKIEQIGTQIEAWEAEAEAGVRVPEKVELPGQLPEELKVRITKALENVQADPKNRTRWQEELVGELINQLKQEGYLATDEESHQFYKQIWQMPDIGMMTPEDMYELPGGAIRIKNNQPIIYFHPLLRRKDIPQPLQYPSDYQLYAVLEEIDHLYQMQEKIKRGEKLEITWEDEIKAKGTLLLLADFLGFDDKRKEWIKREREKTEKEVEAALGVPASHEVVKQPIEENVIYRKKARIFPDLHGAIEIQTGSTARAKRPKTGLTEFLTDLSENELFVSAGDIFDRGPYSWEAAEKMMELVKNGQGVWDYGNHEFLFMASIVDDPSGKDGDIEALGTWFISGGDEMAEKAGVDITDYKNKIQEIITRWKNTLHLDIDYERAKEIVCKDRSFMKTISIKIKSNNNLQNLFKFLQQHGKTYSVVDTLFDTHAGLLVDSSAGDFLPVMINGANFGTGVEAMDKIQEEIRKGNSEVIIWLANHGGNDKLNAENPFWVRETYFNALQNPVIAHKIRENLNKQLAKKGTVANLLVTAHTRQYGGRQFPTIPLATGEEPIRFLFFDEGYYKKGEPRMVQLVVPDDKPDSVVVFYLNPKTKERVVDPTDASKKLEFAYSMDRKVENH